jgi:hypothetical protein
MNKSYYRGLKRRDLNRKRELLKSAFKNVIIKYRKEIQKSVIQNNQLLQRLRDIRVQQ